jgi:hypothetical protein
MTETFAYPAAPPRRRGLVRRHPWTATVLAFVLCSAVGAIAAWFVTTSGPATTKGATLTSPTLVAASSAETTADLFPGQNGTLTLKVHNPNPADIYLSEVSDGVQAVTSSNAGSGCSASNVTLNTRTGLHIGPIPANQTSVIQVPAAVHMDENAPTSCQASLFTFGTINAGFVT